MNKKKYPIENIRNNFYKKKNLNLYFLMQKRFEWMNYYIKNKKSIGLEVGTGADFAKAFIKNKNLKSSDYASWKHLDFKNIDAHKTPFKSSSYDYVIAVNMIHHLQYPKKFLNEIYRILKTKGKLIIFEPNGSLFLRVILNITQHESFDKNIDIWDLKKKSKKKDPWDGNNAIADLLFENKQKFSKFFNKKFKIIYEEKCEFLTFLNSGGVYFRSYYIPLNKFLQKLLWIFDEILTKLFPSIFALGKKIVLEKI